MPFSNSFNWEVAMYNIQRGNWKNKYFKLEGGKLLNSARRKSWKVVHKNGDYTKSELNLRNLVSIATKSSVLNLNPCEVNWISKKVKRVMNNWIIFLWLCNFCICNFWNDVHLNVLWKSLVVRLRPSQMYWYRVFSRLWTLPCDQIRRLVILLF